MKGCLRSKDAFLQGFSLTLQGFFMEVNRQEGLHSRTKE